MHPPGGELSARFLYFFLKDVPSENYLEFVKITSIINLRSINFSTLNRTFFHEIYKDLLF